VRGLQPRPYLIVATGLLLAALLGFVGTLPALAADDETTERITLSPVSKRYTLDAGKVQTDKVTVINDGQAAYDFIVYARPYSVQNEQYEPDFVTAAPKADAYQWIQFNKTTWHLEPGQRVDIDYTVRVPAKAASGGHYGVIFAETQPAAGTGDSVVRKKRVGTIIYANVNGQVSLSGDVLKMNIPFWQTEPPLMTSLSLHNTGNTDFEAQTTLTVKDLFGQTKFKTSRTSVVLPETTRLLPINWDNAPWFGLFKAELHTSFLDKNASTSQFVLLMPKWLPVILLVVIIGGVYAALRRHRR
jgi:hypothetical protein